MARRLTPNRLDQRTSIRVHATLVTLIASILFLGIPAHVDAAPSTEPAVSQQNYQTPDWMSSDAASRLAIGIDVYAPPYVPAPFGGEPQVQAYQGYYSFYWNVPGAPPTFLRVTGEYGGVIPDFSYYDRNIQLQQNTSVQGYAAYHDVSPIYDVVYWRVGEVVYTVESHNLVSDDSLSLANMLVLVTPPVSPDPPTAPQQGQEQETPARQFTIGVPGTVRAGETAAIGVQGEGDVLLTAQAGYFTGTGENTVVVSGGMTVDWVAPEYEADETIFFYVYDLDSGEELGSASTLLQGFLSAGEEIEAEIQCPPQATAGRQARVMVVGNGTIDIVATDGSFPAESPNSMFQPNAAGGGTLSGTLPEEGSATLSWLAPSTTGTVFLSALDTEGNVLSECGISVVTTSVSGDLGAVAGGFVPGDGTGVVLNDRSILLRAIANPTGFAGDASGGPEANGPDYGYTPPSDGTDPGGMPATAESDSEVSAEQEAEDESAMDEAAFGPATGANGMVAIGMNRSGGRLDNPAGASIIVPQGALEDLTTVMIVPVPDHELPVASGVDLIPGTAFDVAFSRANGQAAGELAAPAELIIAPGSGSIPPDARIYRIDGASIKPMPEAAADDGEIAANVTELARYVVGVPAPVAAGSTRPFDPLIVGGLGFLALLSAGLLISRGLQQRKTRIIPVRRPAPHRVRYR
jgi:hypothetical protein